MSAVGSEHGVGAENPIADAASSETTKLNNLAADISQGITNLSGQPRAQMQAELSLLREDSFKERSPEAGFTYSFVERLVHATNCDNFGTLQSQLRDALGGRSLTKEEKGCISRAVHELRFDRADAARAADSIYLHTDRAGGAGASAEAIHLHPHPYSNFLLVTAYSSDYAPGPLCAAVNRQYAERLGYPFVCEVFPPDEMRDMVSTHLPTTCLTYPNTLLPYHYATTTLLPPTTTNH
jgi:hypothetical protein